MRTREHTFNINITVRIDVPIPEQSTVADLKAAEAEALVRVADACRQAKDLLDGESGTSVIALSWAKW